MHFGPESKVQNIVFSNLALKDITGPISIDLNNRGRNDGSAQALPAAQRGFMRNISFNNIRRRHGGGSSTIFAQNYRPGRTGSALCSMRSAIAFRKTLRWTMPAFTCGSKLAPTKTV